MDYKILRDTYINSTPEERLAHVREHSGAWSDKNIEQVLKLACMHNFEEVAVHLFDQAPSQTQKEALFWAVTCNHVNLVACLLQHPNTTHYAQEAIGHNLKSLEMVSVLLPHCQNLQYDMCSLLRSVIKNGDMQIIDLFLGRHDPKDRLFGVMEALFQNNQHTNEVVRKCLPIANNNQLHVSQVVWEAYMLSKHDVVEELMEFCGAIDPQRHNPLELNILSNVQRQYERKKLEQATNDSSKPEAPKKKM